MMEMIVIAFISCIIAISAQPEGWRMIDRFYGFRYSINLIDADSVATIRQFADALGCFGWIQNVGDEKYVGEARCSKSNGIKFEEAVRSLSSEVETKVYSDTKIRLHFSHFKVVETTRETCFLDEPHKCKDLFDEESALNDLSHMSSHSNEL
mmetsp:Transcript_16576/g.15917  ORF Transcript_16576/g.15917 Transcript_16576/m.15917 type:complete len:152 (-) Transcript_16576:111-566(-)